jgi:hypothetical protein
MGDKPGLQAVPPGVLIGVATENWVLPDDIVEPPALVVGTNIV